jgi:ketosteroid isomerase-like protein
MTDRQSLLEATYAAFNARDMDGALQSLQPEVDWPNGMEGGRVHGHSGVREYWTRQWGMIDPHVDPVGFESDDEGRVVVRVHQLVRDLGGAVLFDQMVLHVYRFRDDLIQSMEIREYVAG